MPRELFGEEEIREIERYSCKYAVPPEGGKSLKCKRFGSIPRKTFHKYCNIVRHQECSAAPDRNSRLAKEGKLVNVWLLRK